MAKTFKHARAIATALADLDGVEVIPDPPQTPMMHINLRTTAEIFDAGVRRLAIEQGLWAFGGSSATDTPGVRGVELYVGDATLALTHAEIAQAVRALLPA